LFARPLSEAQQEAVLDEMPLPSDWDASKVDILQTPYRSIVAYAKKKASKFLGKGSSRVAVEVEYQGRPTVIKVAKNIKGLAQNEAEANILSDPEAKKLDILIPMIDYDTSGKAGPVWVHMEKLKKRQRVSSAN
jgi:hypothetical protein